MRISDLHETQVKLGLKIRSLIDPNRIGTIVEVNLPPNETYWKVQWTGDDKPTTGFYYNCCNCEIVE